MKKLLSVFIIVAILLTALVGCSKSNDENVGSDGGFAIPEGLNGTDVIKLLLASQRLDAQLLKNDGDIFENGTAVMNTLASRAKANLPKVTPLSTVIEAKRGGKVEIDGNTFKWSNFVENCNSYDYFENITSNIVHSAEQGATLIDETKKYVRIVDKWVAIGETEYYLHVDENSETIYSRDDTGFRICKRYKNTSGENTYELYSSSNAYETRMLYVPGLRYEWSERYTDESLGATYFVADNSKGFWETFIVGEFPDHYNVSCFVMKNDICYDAIYSPEEFSFSLLKTMSSDRATDILFFTEDEGVTRITLHLGAFDGIDSVEINAPSDKVATSSGPSSADKSVIYVSDSAESWAATTGEESAVINLANGKSIVSGSTYANGSVTAERTVVSYGSGIYTGNLELRISGESDDEILANLKTFLNETGLECRRNIDNTLRGIRRAYVELDSFIDCYKWNGYKIEENNGIASAITEEGTAFDDLIALYTDIKNDDVIDFTDKEAVELSISLSPVTVAKSGNASFADMTVSISGLQLTVTDTTLFVKDEAYIVNFALLKNGAGIDDIVHVSTENPTEIIYTDTDTFTVGTANATVEIPVLSEGEYTLVAYVATNDKIRASQYIPVVFTEISTEEIDLGGMTLLPAKNENNEIVLSFIKNVDVTVQLSSENDIDYAVLYTLLAKEAYKYGAVSDLVEEYDPESDSFSALTGSEELIESGVYRLAYSVQNGDISVNGYIYAEYTSPDAK